MLSNLKIRIPKNKFLKKFPEWLTFGHHLDTNNLTKRNQKNLIEEVTMKINPDRIYNLHEFARIINFCYSDADEPSNVRYYAIKKDEDVTTYCVNYADIDMQYIEFTIKVRNRSN